MGVSLTIKITVAKKFRKYLNDNMIMPDTRTKLKELYLETYRPTLEDPEEKRVNFGALLFCLKKKLGYIVRTNQDDQEKIVYANGLSAVVLGLKKKLVANR